MCLDMYAVRIEEVIHYEIFHIIHAQNLHDEL